MMVVTVIFSLAAVVIANLMIRVPNKVGPTLCAVATFPIAFFAVAGHLPKACVTLWMAVSFASLPWTWKQVAPKYFVPVSIVALAVGWGFVLRAEAEHAARTAARRTAFPFDSLADRLPPRVSSSPGEVATLADYVEPPDDSAGPRMLMLKKVHDEYTGVFVAAPEFGWSRMRSPEYVLRRPPPDPVPQPEPTTSAALTADAGLKATAAGGASRDLHFDHVRETFNADDFGLVRDGKVAGFRGHVPSGDAMREAARRPAGYHIGSIDLVGLLRHAEPVAYVSANLPRMDELRDAPTRPLTPFEAGALARLRKGEHVVAAEAGERVRMLGAIRMSAACAKCHDGAVGSLLGAFSYTLKRNP